MLVVKVWRYVPMRVAAKMRHALKEDVMGMQRRIGNGFERCDLLTAYQFDAFLKYYFLFCDLRFDGKSL